MLVIVKVIQVIAVLGIAIRINVLGNTYRRNIEQNKDSSHEVMSVFLYTLVLLCLLLF